MKYSLRRNQDSRVCSRVAWELFYLIERCQTETFCDEKPGLAKKFGFSSIKSASLAGWAWNGLKQKHLELGGILRRKFGTYPEEATAGRN